MATQPSIFIQNENLPIHRGKGVDGVKVEVPKREKTGKQERKALRDLSKADKPPVSGASKGGPLKEKPTVHDHGSNKNAPKTSFLTEEELEKCREWAKEGIEGTQFTGNNQQKLQKEQQEQRIRKKVGKALAGIRAWEDEFNARGVYQEGFADDTNDIMEMELVPEMDFPIRDIKEQDFGIDQLGMMVELDEFPFLDYEIELRLKEEFM